MLPNVKHVSSQTETVSNILQANMPNILAWIINYEFVSSILNWRLDPCIYIFACIGGRIDLLLYVFIRRVVTLPSYVGHGYMSTPVGTHYFYPFVFAKLS